MLIVPAENKPDWSNPPLITIGLILVNLLVFLFYQGNDEDIAENAMQTYQAHNLIEVERDNFLDYLEMRYADDPVFLAQINDDVISNEHLIQLIFFDRDFDQYLQTLWQQDRIPLTEVTQTWRVNRQLFEQQRNRLSAIAAGLTPAEAKPWTFLTSIFLHGSWAHLLGNMVFLFLFGFALEAVLRPHVFLGMYLASGVVASALFVVLNLGSYVPLVGASGAISGLMGMYLALYQFRRIRFFYTVFFYFGEFRAPALLVLPLWLAKELYGHFFEESNTAYFAHIGGLLAGALMMFFAKESNKQFAETQTAKTQDDEIESTLKKIRLAMTQLEYSKAQGLARWLCDRHSTNPSTWHTLFDLHKLQPHQDAFHQTVFTIVKQFCDPQSNIAEWQPHIETMLKEYSSIASVTPALSGDCYLEMASKYWANDAYQKAEAHLALAQQKGANRQATLHLLEAMQAYYHQRGRGRTAARLSEEITRLSSQ